MVEELISRDINVNFAVVEFRDIFADGIASTKIKTFGESNDLWTSDVEEVESTLDLLTADGGGDGPETPTDAMMKFYNSADFRPDASRFAFLLTDAEAKGTFNDYRSIPNDEKLPNMSTITTKFRQASIYNTVVSRAEFNDPSRYYYYQKDYHDLYTETGGKYININSDDYSIVMDDIFTSLKEKRLIIRKCSN